MIHTIHIETQQTAVILERVMSTTRVRGFTPKQLEVQSSTDATFNITMTVESKRPIERLTHQLTKICGVKHLTALHSVETETIPQQIEPYNSLSNGRCNQAVMG